MSQERVVRAAIAGDVGAVKRIAVETGLFEPDELGEFEEILSGYLDGTLEDSCWLVLEGHDGEVIGAAYYAPEPFSDRIWNLFFVGVMPEHQASGAGSALIEHVENTLRRAGEARARVLIVETSGLDTFELTRSFYRRRGYEEEARIRQFYGPDDDKIVFWKSLTTSRAPARARRLRALVTVMVTRKSAIASGYRPLIWCLDVTSAGMLAGHGGTLTWSDPDAEVGPGECAEGTIELFNPATFPESVGAGSRVVLCEGYTPTAIAHVIE